MRAEFAMKARLNYFLWDINLIMAKRGRKKVSNPKEFFLKFRVTKKDLNRIQFLSRTYAGGVLSDWLLHGALNAPREFLRKK
jgi:hypothetical protein